MDTYEKIKKIATEHFGKYGYNGASLSKISADVGIKKPSLYAHYDSKQDLFEACMDAAMSDFMKETEELLSVKGKKASTVLYELISCFLNSEGGSNNRLFYLRFAYMPPEEMGENKVRYSNEFIERLALILDGPFKDFLNELGVDPDRKEEIEEAYLCMFDGLIVELLFGEKDTYSRRMEYAWNVFMRGVK